MEGDRLMPLFFVALALGLREGEAFGLTWANVDLDRGLLHVKQQVQPKRGGGFEFADPKTASSRSTLELTENQVSMLTAHRKALAKERLAAGSDWEDYDLLFPSTRGTPLSASNVRRNFNMILDSAGFAGAGFMTGASRQRPGWRT
jgi:integrase